MAGGNAARTPPPAPEPSPSHTGLRAASGTGPQPRAPWDSLQHPPDVLWGLYERSRSPRPLPWSFGIYSKAKVAVLWNLKLLKTCLKAKSSVWLLHSYCNAATGSQPREGGVYGASDSLQREKAVREEMRTIAI